MFTLYFSFLCICSSVKRASLCTLSHYHRGVYVSARPYYVLFPTKSCLMSFVKPSHAFKLESVLYSYCLTVQISNISHKILFNVVFKAFSCVQIRVGSLFILLDSTNFQWLWMKKCNSLSSSCIFHTWTETDKLNRSLRFQGNCCNKTC